MLIGVKVKVIHFIIWFNYFNMSDAEFFSTVSKIFVTG